VNPVWAKLLKVVLTIGVATSAFADYATINPPIRYPLSDVYFAYRGGSPNVDISVHGDGKVWRYDHSGFCPQSLRGRDTSAQVVVELLRLCYQSRFFELPSEYVPLTRDVRLTEDGLVEVFGTLAMTPEPKYEYVSVHLGAYSKVVVFVEDGNPPAIVRELAKRLREIGGREP